MMIQPKTLLPPRRLFFHLLAGAVLAFSACSQPAPEASCPIEGGTAEPQATYPTPPRGNVTFYDPTGQKVLGVAMALWLIGILWTNKLLSPVS